VPRPAKPSRSSLTSHSRAAARPSRPPRRSRPTPIKRAKGFLNQQVASGADLAGHVADSVRSAADNLDHSAPQLANFVRNAAERVEEFSEDMRGKSVEELVRTASDFTRRQPALVFGLASLAGFVLLRKSNPPTGSRDGHRGGERFEGSRQFHGV